MEKIQNELKHTTSAASLRGKTKFGIKWSRGVLGLGQTNAFLLLLLGANISGIVNGFLDIYTTKELNDKGYDKSYDNKGPRVKLGANGRSGIYL